MHRAEVRIPMEGERAKKVADALMPEAIAEIADTRLGIDLEKEGLLLTFEAKDASGLRAALNSYTRLALVAMKITQ